MKKCMRCKKNKKGIAFKRETLCWKCFADRGEERSEKYMKRICLGKRALSNTGKIIVLQKYFQRNFVTSRKVAFGIMKKAKHKVINKHAIYLTEFLDPDAEDIVTRATVLERDSFTCYYCKEDGDTVDHIHPKSKGGKFTEDNLVVACKRCNEMKADKLLSREQLSIITNKLKQERKKAELDAMIEKALNR